MEKMKLKPKHASAPLIQYRFKISEGSPEGIRVTMEERICERVKYWGSDRWWEQSWWLWWGDMSRKRWTRREWTEWGWWNEEGSWDSRCHDNPMDFSDLIWWM